MFELRYANDRGKANFGWLQSQHTFSFGNYFDANHMGFSALRVINDDRVSPGAGFNTHGHRDMEILSLVLTGALAHKDSAGNTKVLPAGEYQLMSAGSGIYHSEFNASDKEDVTFLQIWLQPSVMGGQSTYQQKNFGQNNGLTLIFSPDGQDESLTIKQDARLYQLILSSEQKQDFTISTSRKLYIHLISGELDVSGHKMLPGDGMKVTFETAVQLQAKAQGETKALIFDLP